MEQGPEIDLIKPAKISGSLERLCREECQNIPKSRCEKLVTSSPRRVEAGTAAKGSSLQRKGSEYICQGVL